MEVNEIRARVVNLTNNIVNKFDSIDYRVLLLLFGLLVILIVILSVFVPCPTSFQKIILRLAITIGITGLFSSVSSNWEGKSKEYRGLLSFFLFMIIYIGSQFGIKANDCPSYFYSEGQVFKRDKVIKGVTIRLPHQDFEMSSNGSGEFFIPWKNDKDSSKQVLVQMEWEEGDTSFYWTKSTEPLIIHLPDYFIPLSKSIIDDLLKERIVTYKKEKDARLVEWQLDTNLLSNYERLIALYKPFESIKGYQQNNYEFNGLNQNLKYKRRLNNAGIWNLKPPAPYQKHGLDSCSIYILNKSLKERFKLSYVLLNLNEVEPRTVHQQRISDTHYRLTVTYENNICGVRVDLEEQRRKNILKVRHMKLFGFLPKEEYEVKFKYGKWTIN